MDNKKYLVIGLATLIVLGLGCVENKLPTSEKTPISNNVEQTKTSDAEAHVLDQDNSSSFFAGGIVEYYLADKIWDGKWRQVDPLRTLHENGFDWVSVRLTARSSPVLSSTSPEDWGKLSWDWHYFRSLQYVEQMMKEASDIGMKLNLVFFLSDEEASGARQNAPPEWQNLTLDELTIAVQDYCFKTTKYFKDKGFNVEIYDIGNEIDFGILNYRPGEKIPPPSDNIQYIEYMKNNVWNIEAKLLKAAINGVKTADSDAKITLHVHKLDSPLFVSAFLETMIEEGVEFDYVGLTYPPAQPNWWVRFNDHPGSWMRPIIDSIKSLNKKVIISEFLYPSDPTGVTAFEMPQNPPKWMTHVPVPGYPFTPEGQAKAVKDLMSFWREDDTVIGAFYFWPDTFRGSSEGNVYHGLPDDFYGLFETDSQIRPAILQFGTIPPSFPTVGLVDETNVDKMVLVNETDTSFVWLGDWGIDYNSCHIGGTRKFSEQSGDKVDIQFTGTAISLIYHENQDHGIAEIAVDGVRYPDVDMYAPKGRCRAEKVIATNLAPSEHVLTITVSDRKNSASVRTLVIVDAARILQATSPSSFIWSGDWKFNIGGEYNGGTYMGSTESGAMASINFTGTGIALIYATNNNHGIAEIEIDGIRYPNIDMYSPEFISRITDVIATDLSPSEHILTITVSGDKNPSSSDNLVVVDAVDIIKRGS